MDYFVYILYSKTADQYYVGHTSGFAGQACSSQPWPEQVDKKVSDSEIVFFEEYATRSQAMLRETEIRKRKSRKYIENLITIQP